MGMSLDMWQPSVEPESRAYLEHSSHVRSACVPHAIGRHVLELSCNSSGYVLTRAGHLFLTLPWLRYLSG